ncbi:hypothetical protein U1Q18_022986 [Sarracenia purpurea var. burkii]
MPRVCLQFQQVFCGFCCGEAAVVCAAMVYDGCASSGFCCGEAAVVCAAMVCLAHGLLNTNFGFCVGCASSG